MFPPEKMTVPVFEFANTPDVKCTPVVKKRQPVRQIPPIEK
jgi:hypothetical protein